MKQRTMGVTEFKAHCLKLLDDIGAHGGTITVTKRGRPLAAVGPAKKVAWKSLEGSWAKRVKLPVDPVDLSHLWRVLDSGDRE